jgi:hypothetical protein
VQARDLYQLLGSPGKGASLREVIAPAVAAHEREKTEGGRSDPEAGGSDGALLPVAMIHLVNLCEAFLAEDLNSVELDYIATTLERSPDFHFVTGTVEEANHFLTREPSPDQVTAILRVLREHAA